MRRKGKWETAVTRSHGALDDFALTLYLGSSLIRSTGATGTTSRLLKKAVCRLVKKISEARLRRQLSRAAREKSTSGGVLTRYVEATPLGAGMIPARSSATILNACLRQAGGIPVFFSSLLGQSSYPLGLLRRTDYEGCYCRWNRFYRFGSV